MKPAFGVLGPLLTPAGTIGATKHRILLASLLMRPGEPVSVEELTGHLWDFDPPERPKAAIQTYVKRLRQVLGAAVIRTSGRGYLADVPPESVDVCQFRELTRAADSAGPADRARLLGEALELWRGQPFADVPSPALRADYGVRLTGERARALELRFAAESELGRSGELVAGLRAATAEFPLNEELWGQLMLALYRSNRQAEALEAFTEVSRVLMAELGAGTGARLRELHQLILTQDDSLGPPSPTAPAEHRVIPAQLPLDVPDFVGRAEVSAKIISSLRESVPVILSGPPGVGKTALAVRIGHALRRHFPDGQLYVNLRGFDVHAPMTPVRVLSRFLRGLGVAADQIPADEQELAAQYQACVRHRRVLVVLDNAVSTAQVRDLLPVAQGCATLITSRNELPELVEAHHRQLGVLSLDDSRELLAATISSAVAVTEPQAVDALASLCSFLPLALRIAAANIATSPRPDLRHFVAELRGGNRLDDLSISGDEHTAIKTAFDLSYLALPPEARQLFSRMSLVPGADFTSAQAAVLMNLSPDEAQPLLDRLSTAHLIQRQQGDRYSFHDLLRLYASHKLQESAGEAQRQELRSALYSHYLTSAKAACARLYPGVFHLYPEAFPAPEDSEFADVEPARSWLEAETANLVAAVTQSIQDQLHEFAWGIIDALRRYLQSAGMHTDQMIIGSVGLVSARDVGDRAAEAYMLTTIAQSHIKSADYQQSEGAVNQALAIYRELGSQTGMLHSSNMLGTIGIKIGKIDSAIKHYTSSLDLSDATGNQVGAAIALTNLSSAYWMKGQLQEFSTSAEDAARRAQEVGIEELLAVCQVNMAAGLNSIGKFRRAIPIAKQAQLTSEKVGAKENQILAHNESAIAYYNLGDYTSALAEADVALETSHGTSMFFVEAYSLSIKSLILNKIGDTGSATEFSNRAVSLSEEKGLPENLAFALNCRGIIRKATALDSAIQDTSQAVATSREHGYLLREHQALTTLASLNALSGELYAAQESATEALNKHLSTGHVPGQAHTLHLLGAIAQKSKNKAAAMSYWQEAHELFHAMGMPESAEVEQNIAAYRC
ncbi:BTAD domain-containing putative transcriptional regulator [Crossiella sp. NPDC003009]